MDMNDLPQADNEGSADQDDDSVIIIIDEQLPVSTQSEHIYQAKFNQISKAKSNDTDGVHVKEVLKGQNQAEQSDIKRISNTEKDGNKKTKEVNQQNIKPKQSEINIENDDSIRINIDKEILFKYKQNGNLNSLMDLDIKIIEDALAKNKNKSVLSKETKNTVICTCSEPSGLETSKDSIEYSPQTHQNQRRPAKRKHSGYGYPPKYIFFDTNQEVDPVGDVVEYEDGNRNDFVLKVFISCSIMLAATFGMTAVSYFIPSVRNLLRTFMGLLLLICAGIGTLIVQYTYCCSNCSRAFPCNYILNIIVTMSFSCICSFLANRYDMLIVLSATGTTLAITLLCLCLACTSFDFTRFVLIVTVFCVSLLIASVIGTIAHFASGYKLTLMRLILLTVSSVSGCLMMIVEFQMILGGKAVQLGEEDYTFGAYMIYTSSIGLFIKLMGLVNFVSHDDV